MPEKMFFVSKNAFAIWCMTVMGVGGGVSAFTSSTAPSSRVAFVGQVSSSSSVETTAAIHPRGCACGGCISPVTFLPSSSTKLFADAVAEEVSVPDEVEAMDGVETAEEAHNVDRPARQQLKKKKGNQGKALSEFEVGSTVKGVVKSLATYGAFIDIGATTDGLLHVSQLSTEFVSDVKEVLSERQEVDVRIIKIDEKKNQVGLSMMSAEEEQAASDAQQQRQTAAKERRQKQQDANNRRRDNSATLSSLKEKGYDASVMVEGTVVSTVDFGCFVQIDASTLNPDVTGEFDGLVHVSTMSTQRVRNPSDIVSVNDKVQVRVKSIDGSKVSLTMLSPEDEAAKMEATAGAIAEAEGEKNWKEFTVQIGEDMPTFQNLAVVEDRRK